MIINKDTIRQEVTDLLIRVFQLPEVHKVKIREIEICSADEKDAIEEGIVECFHDILSDVDVGVYVTLHPEDVGHGHGYHSSPERNIKFHRKNKKKSKTKVNTGPDGT